MFFFQVFNIFIKINKGIVEIIVFVEFVKKGDKVGLFEVVFLVKFGIRLFLYGLVVVNIYDSGFVFVFEVLDLIEDDFLDKFVVGVFMVVVILLVVGYLILVVVFYSFVNLYKNLLVIVVEIEYFFFFVEKIKEYFKDFLKFVVVVVYQQFI